MLIEGKSPAQNLRISSESLLPEAMAENRHAGAAFDVLLSTESPSESRLYSQYPKQRGGGDADSNPLRISLPLEVSWPRGVDGHILEVGLAFSPTLVSRIG